MAEELDLLGEGVKTGLAPTDFEFRRGVSTYPLPGHLVYVTTAAELERVFATPSVPSVVLGRASQASGLPVHARVDELLGKHFAILGTTGSGKSCAVASVVHSIVRSHPNAHIVLFDLHDEYGSAFGNQSRAFDPTTISLPHWLLTLEEALELFVGRTEHVATAQINILKDALVRARNDFVGADSDLEVTPDTPIPYRLRELVAAIERDMQPLTNSQRTSHMKILNKIDILRRDRRLSFLIQGDEDVEDTMVDVLSDILRAPVAGCPISTINLSGVPSDVLDIVVSVLSRVLFLFAVWAPAANRMPLLLICEEAHRYVPRGDSAAFSATRAGLERIAKEGRKYGVGLGLISQRPAELSETVLAQCNTIIALRTTNETDQAFVKRAFPDSIRSIVDALSALRTQEALIVGEAVTVPTRFRFADLPDDRQPRSRNPRFSERWQADEYDRHYVASVVDAWRRQRRG